MSALQKLHALARVFGSAGGLFGREDEQQVFSAVADAGLGPKVLVCASLPYTFLYHVSCGCSLLWLGFALFPVLAM